MSRSHPLLQCMECNKDLGDAHQLHGAQSLALCPDCVVALMGHIHAPPTDDEIERMAAWIPATRG